jgi:peptidoglycan hydrolase CwlO-like protein
MATLLENIRKTLEESYDIVRDGASTIIDKAEDFGKISKIRFEIRQTGTNVEKKLTILGDAVFPHLMKNDVEALKDNPAIKLLVEEIQDLNKQMDDKQKEIDRLLAENKKINQQREEEKLHEKITKLEQEIEERMNVLNKLKNE